MERPEPHPDKEDIDKTSYLLNEIKDILVDFISNHFGRLCQNLTYQGILDENYFIDFTDKYATNQTAPIRCRWIYPSTSI